VSFFDSEMATGLPGVVGWSWLPPPSCEGGLELLLLQPAAASAQSSAQTIERRVEVRIVMSGIRASHVPGASPANQRDC
jgi:hypothetical protein